MRVQPLTALVAGGFTTWDVNLGWIAASGPSPSRLAETRLVGVVISI